MIELSGLSPTMSYDMAWLYCLTLSHKGHKDWRMPTRAEWQLYSRISGWYEGADLSEFHLFVVMVRPVRDHV